MRQPVVSPTFFAWFQVGALALFLIVTVARTAQLRIRRKINPVVLNLHKRGLLGAMETALFVGVNLWALLLLMEALPLDLPRPAWLFGFVLLDSAWARWVGIALTGLAFLLRALAMSALGDSWRLGLDEKAPGQLVTSGIYSTIRNPLYVFFDLWFIAAFLVHGTVTLLVFALLAAGNLHYQILQEEHFLTELHGEAYEDYRAHTGRYSPLRLARAAPQRSRLLRER